MEKLYIKWLIEYLNKYINLIGFDNNIKSSSLKFKKLNVDDMDDYQILSNPYLSYFYIRNNIYLDRLDESEKLFLESRVDNYNYDDSVESFIKNTFKKVITEKMNDSNKRYKVTFGAPSENYLAYNDSLVIGFMFDEFYSEGMSDDEWKKNYFNQMEYLNGVFKKIEELGKEKLNNDITVIKYNEYTVTKSI